MAVGIWRASRDAIVSNDSNARDGAKGTLKAAALCDCRTAERNFRAAVGPTLPPVPGMSV
jgi:hypothetical protein